MYLHVANCSVQENEAAIKAVAAKLRASIEALCDKLKDNPNVAENVAKVATERQGLQSLLARSLEELVAQHRAPSLTEAVLAERAKRREVVDVAEKEKAAARAVATLRMELRDERDNHEQVCMHDSLFARTSQLCKYRLWDDCFKQSRLAGSMHSANSTISQQQLWHMCTSFLRNNTQLLAFQRP